MESKMNRSDYEIVKETADYVYIVDLDLGNLSVTNDAERVVMELAPKLYNRRLYYSDSMGNIDEIVIKNGKFAGFRPVDKARGLTVRKDIKKTL